MRRIWLILGASMLIALAGFRTHHHQCSICGVQEYERSFFGFVVEPLSEREYDEWANYHRWRARNGGGDCTHHFLPTGGTAREMN